jgi:hypothetical protein
METTSLHQARAGQGSTKPFPGLSERKGNLLAADDLGDREIAQPRAILLQLFRFAPATRPAHQVKRSIPALLDLFAAILKLDFDGSTSLEQPKNFSVDDARSKGIGDFISDTKCGSPRSI